MRLSALLLLAAAWSQETFRGSAAIDEAIEAAIAAGEMPGAVAWIGQPGRILHRKAYGARALVPSREPMTLDTIFDAASLTKIVATTSSVMRLVEDGKLRLADKVTQYLPRFQGGKSDITVRQLLTHFSGLRPDVDLKPEWSGYQTGIDKALTDIPVAAPGERFIYSDINFILLGEIVRTLSGVPLDEFARQNVFLKLGMTETQFRPPASLRPRIAPTELLGAQPLRGVVHDETTRFMGGVAGHAGLFTSAADLSRFAEMLLGLGQRGNVHLFSPLTVRKFTEPQTPPHQPVLRGFGFDIDSPFSGNRGELFPLGSFGHTGFTGTSLWIDPATRTYVILLSNSVHPRRRPAITPLRAKVATIAAAALNVDAPGALLTSYLEPAPPRALGRSVEVLTGLDVLVEEKFARLKGKRIGLITNHTGLTRSGQRNIDAMRAAGVNLTALFSPEHGLAGVDDHENIAHGKDAASGLTVYSLYQGKDRKPSQAMLKEIDALVFDIQDIGARFYTYMCTLKYAMEAAAATGATFYILDRPNPINGRSVEGPMLDPELSSFVGCAAIPLRHGMTLGELARLFNSTSKPAAKLEVVTMKNWRRSDWWDSTSLPWVDPSPNMRSLNAALLYPGVAMIEYQRDYSVGRGTDAPFEQVGAEWIRGADLAFALNKRFVPGVRFYATRFKPASSHLSGKTIEGVRFVITDREAFSATRLGVEIIAALIKLYPGKLDLAKSEKLIGNRKVIQALERGEDARTVELDWIDDLRRFEPLRRAQLLYQ